MHRDGVDTACPQPLDEAVSSTLGSHEDERQPPIAAQLANECLDAVLLFDLNEAVLDIHACSAPRRADLTHRGP